VMESIARLALFALTELRPAERLSAGASRITAAAALSAAAVLVLTAAFACLVAAGWIALIPIIGPAGAAASAAGALVVVAAILWLLARSRGHEHEHAHEEHPAVGTASLVGLQKGLSGLGNDALQEVQRLWGDNKTPVLLSALVAGMAMGGKPANGAHHNGADRD
jgi:hypothetical protein